MDLRSHWETVYRTKSPREVSWYRPHLDTSLALIDGAAPDRDASIIDVGGGTSTLVDDLVQHGYRDVTVLDVSAIALDVAKARLGAAAARIDWRCGDMTTMALPVHRYDVWHDRAVFHFLTQAEDRAAYVGQVRRSVKHGGCVIVATFAADGPAKCSGLDVVRYGHDTLSEAFGAGFRLERQLAELHRTPMGTMQPFTYCAWRIERD